MSAALIVQILNMIQAGFNWLTARGINRDRVQAMLDEKNTSGDDFTTTEVQAELDTLQGELNETENLIDENFDPSD